MMTLSAQLRARLGERADAVALLWEGEVLTYADLDAWSAALAGELRDAGIRPGDRVAVGVANSPVLVAAVLAVLRSGAVLVPLNPSAPVADAAYAIEHSGAALVLLGGEECERWDSLEAPIRRLTDARAVDDDRSWFDAGAADPALLVYTSGTTGKPKGAVLSHAALGTNLATVAEAWRWTAADRLLLTLPCFHLHGLALGILGSLAAGASVALQPRFVAEDVPELLARHRCTLFFGVPTMYNRLIQLSDGEIERIPAMRLWVSGSAPLTTATFEEFRRRFGFAILERFGMSEGGFMIATPYHGERRPGVVGFALPGVEIRIADPDSAGATVVDVADGEPGEILIRGPNLFSGYWRDAEATARAYRGDYFRSGDLALREPDGQIRIVGRLSVDIIKCRGFKISAIEIENALQTHPGVAEVAVVGVPHADLGEQIVAVVTPATDAAADLPAVLVDYARSTLARHKVPGRIELMSEIPRTGPGKFKKRALIERFSA